MKTLTNILLLVCVVVLAGCYEAVDERVSLQEGVRSDTIESNVITRPIGAAVSLLIGEGIEITDVKPSVNKSGFMEVQVSGYNRAVGTRRFEYKTEWLDSKGVVIDTKTSTWLPVSAVSKSRFSFMVVSPSRDAVDFRINTRPIK